MKIQSIIINIKKSARRPLTPSPPAYSVYSREGRDNAGPPILNAVYGHFGLWLSFFKNCFSRVCHYLRMLQGQQFYPMSFPRIPQDEILDCVSLQKIVLELASTLEVSMLFYTTDEIN